MTLYEESILDNCKDGSKVILVTGGAGFLGQHIVRELQDEDVDEIRVFDCKPFENKLGFIQKRPIVSIVGDLRSMDDLRVATKGVFAVIHTASLVDVRMFEDSKAMEEVNVKGTANVIQSCIDAGVLYLIYTSTIDVVIAHDEIIDGDESLPYPKHHLFRGYATTKATAERLVIAANGVPLTQGSGVNLRSVILRSSTMFGEGDPYYVTNILRAARQTGGTFYRIGNGLAKFQQAYAGNMAWAHVCAVKTLLRSSTATAMDGRAFFITDDTPVMNIFDFCETFMKIRNFRFSRLRLPYRLMYAVVFLLTWLFWLLRSILGKNSANSNISLSVVISTNLSVYFKRTLAERNLDYRPKYTYRESLEKCLPYYRDLEL